MVEELSFNEREIVGGERASSSAGEGDTVEETAKYVKRW